MFSRQNETILGIRIEGPSMTLLKRLGGKNPLYWRSDCIKSFRRGKVQKNLKNGENQERKIERGEETQGRGDLKGEQK